MPKVTEAHLEARRQQIVDAAFACFARKGFHPTTMQDICAEAKLSPGAIYRYFDSKETIIAGACRASEGDTDLDLLRSALAEPDTSVMMGGLVTAFFSDLEGERATLASRAMLQLWAEMVTNPAVRRSYEERHGMLRSAMLDVVAEAQRRGDFAAGLDPEAVVSAMMALYHGFQMQKAMVPETDTAAYAEVVRAMLTGGFWAGGVRSG
jgi:AcrR family transcriptional regulator